MASNNHIKTIALIGVSPHLYLSITPPTRQTNQPPKASGTIGSQILTCLLATSHFNITIITRDYSPSTFPPHPSITLQKGSYSSPSFLASAFRNVDAAIFALNFMAMGEQTTLIDAAAKAGVKWILPTEYAGDGLNEEMVEGVPLFHPKREARRQVEALGEDRKSVV